jgi:hypothetical protein
MVKPLQVPAPIKLTHAQAIEITLKPLCRYGDLIVQDGRLRSCLAPSIKQRTGSFEQPATRLYIETLYIGGGWLESLAHMDDAELSFEFHGVQGMGDNTLQVNAEVDLSHTDRALVHLKIARADALKSAYPDIKRATPFAQAQRGRRTGSANLKRQAKLAYIESLFIGLENPTEKSVRAADEKGKALLSDVKPSTLRSYLKTVREMTLLVSQSNT